MLTELSDPEESTPELFGPEEASGDPLMRVVDRVNGRFGRDVLGWGFDRKPGRDWKMRQQRLSPKYTTRWSDLPVAVLRP